MAKIKIIDYTEIIEDDWWGFEYEVFHCIGSGNLSQDHLVPLIEAVPAGEDIEVEISSCGGSVYHGWAIYNALVKHRTEGKGRVIIHNIGMAFSIASIILMAGDEIVMHQASMIMIHKPSICGWYFNDNLTDEDLDRESASLKQIQAVCVSIYQGRTGMDAEAINALINKETYITPQEAVTLGFADRVQALPGAPAAVMIPEMAFKGAFKNANNQTMTYVNSFVKIKSMATFKEAQAKSAAQKKKAQGIMNSIKKFVNTLVPGSVEEDVDDIDAVVDGSAELKAGGTLYFDGDSIEVGTEVFTDEERTTHPAEGTHDLSDGNTITVGADGIVSAIEPTESAEGGNEVENLRLQVVNLKKERDTAIAERNAAVAEMEEATEMLAQATSLMQKVKETSSKYTPQTRTEEFTNGKDKVKSAKDKGTDKPDYSRDAREERRKQVAEQKKNK